MTPKDRIAHVKHIAADVSAETNYFAPWLRQDDGELAEKLEALGEAAREVTRHIARRSQ
jgi:hypothetical protein